MEQPGRDQPSRIAVWSTTVRHLEFVNALSEKRWPNLVYPPRAENPNLAAQEGVFTLCRQEAKRSDGAQQVDRRPINKIVADEIRGADEATKNVLCQMFVPDDLDDETRFFFAYTVPISESPCLLSMLQSRGYDAGRLFPGYGGAAIAVRNDARVNRLSWSDRR